MKIHPDHHQPALFLGVGLAAGLVHGEIFGALLDDPGLCLGVGIALGLATGAIFALCDPSRRKRGRKGWEGLRERLADWIERDRR